MAADLFVNSIVGLVSGTPDNASSYIMALTADPRWMGQEFRTPGDYVMLGIGNKVNRLKGPPQADTEYMNSIVGQTVAGDVTSYMMALTADPQSSAGWALSGNLRGNRKCNYPPQIGA